jgi:hypothetical protein
MNINNRNLSFENPSGINLNLLNLPTHIQFYIISEPASIYISPDPKLQKSNFQSDNDGTSG